MSTSTDGPGGPNERPTGKASKVSLRMRYLPRALLAGAVGFAVALLAGCGSSGGLLSADQASTLNNQLNSVSSALSAHNCPAVATATANLTDSASSLSGVDGNLSTTVAEVASSIAGLAKQQCPVSASAATNTSSTASTASTATTTPPPTNTQTTTSTTTATATTPTQTATTPASTGTTSTGGTGGAGLGGGNGSSGSGGSGSGGQGGNGPTVTNGGY